MCFPAQSLILIMPVWPHCVHVLSGPPLSVDAGPVSLLLLEKTQGAEGGRVPCVSAPRRVGGHPGECAQLRRGRRRGAGPGEIAAENLIAVPQGSWRVSQLAKFNQFHTNSQFLCFNSVGSGSSYAQSDN